MTETTPAPFRNELGHSIFKGKYTHENAETWHELATTLVEDVCGDILPLNEREELTTLIAEMKFIPGGRYLYYAGRKVKFFNNCFLLKALEDTREDWADLSYRAESCLLTGGGIGSDYSVYREKGSPLGRTGGVASGPVSKARSINEIGREARQGGGRRSAIYASLNWQHPDAYHSAEKIEKYGVGHDWMTAKDWDQMLVPGTDLSLADVKNTPNGAGYNFPAPLDITNISLNYDNAFLSIVYDMPFPELLAVYQEGGKEAVFNLEVVHLPPTFVENVRKAMKTAEPGFSFNFFEWVNETLRNACTEVTSEDDSDVCNLGSLNMSRIKIIEEFERATYLAGRFLLCGTTKADLPFDKVYEVREKNRRLGLGIMGVHEWLLQRGKPYEVDLELREWLQVYKDESETGANALADELGINRPVAYRAIAPTGTIGTMAGTTTGIEPIFAVAYKRFYFVGEVRKYQYVIEGAAKEMIQKYNLDPSEIETCLDLAMDPERRIKFQADVQDYVDMAISSTINLPEWGSDVNCEEKVESMAKLIAKYAVRLRGLTFYPDGSRGGQPLQSCPYEEALEGLGQEFEATVEWADQCKGGVCGI